MFLSYFQKDGQFMYLLTSGVLASLLLNTIPVTVELKSENQNYHVQLTDYAPCCPAVLELQVFNKETEKYAHLRFESNIDSVTALTLKARDHLVIEGEHRYRGDVVLIADLRLGVLEAEILTYGYSFSPSGRYLVYATHFPPMIPGEARRSIVLLYDFEKDAAQNRWGRPRADFPEANQGIPIFPEINVEQKSHNVLLSNAHLYVSPFLWSPEENSIVFFVGNFDWEYNLVLVRLDSAGAVGEIKRKLVDVHALKLFPAEEYLEPPRFQVDKLEWKNETTIIATTPPQYRLKKRVEFTLP